MNRSIAQKLPIALIAISFLGLLAAALLPVLMVKIPAMIDYPNHLGRLYVISQGQHDSLLSRFYRIDWQIIPNLAMDGIVPLLAPSLGIFAAGRVFVALTMVLMLTGPFAIQKALFGRLSPWPLVGFLVVYNWIFIYGFTNFLFGLGVALWGIAAWIRWRGGFWVWRLLISLGFSAILFISHLHALGLYGMTLLCFESQHWHAQNTQAGRRVWPDPRDIAAFALPFLAMLGLMTRSPTIGHALDSSWTLEAKFEGLYFIIKNYWTPLDLVLGLAGLGFIIYALRRGWLVPHPLAKPVLLVSTALFVVMPTELFGSWFADVRLPIATCFILVGMAEWAPQEVRAVRRFCTGVVTLALIRFAVVALVWHNFSETIQQFEASFQKIPRGSTILTTQMPKKDLRQTYAAMFVHIPSLALAERSSFVPLTFSGRGKQVLEPTNAYADIAVHEGRPPLIDKLIHGEIDTSNTPITGGNDGYYLDWRRRFDYVYLLYAESGTVSPDPALDLVYQGQEFQLYRVKKPG